VVDRATHQEGGRRVTLNFCRLILATLMSFAASSYAVSTSVRMITSANIGAAFCGWLAWSSSTSGSVVHD
jgi:hypothetical protein